MSTGQFDPLQGANVLDFTNLAGLKLPSGTTWPSGFTLGPLTNFGQLNVFQVAAYGAAGDGVTDDSAAIAKAIAAAAAANGGIVLFQPKTYAVASTIVNKWSHVKLVGAGSDSYHYPGPVTTSPTSGTVLKWTGAANGTILSLLPVSGGTRRPVGCDVVGIAFDSNAGSASIGLSVQSITGAWFYDLAFSGFNQYALYVGCVPTGTITGDALNTDISIFERIVSINTINSGVSLFLTGEATHTYDVAQCVFRQLLLDVLILDFADHNSFYQVDVGPNYAGYGSTNPAVELRQRAFSNNFFELTVNPNPLIARNGSNYNAIWALDWSAQATNITIEAGAGLFYTQREALGQTHHSLMGVQSIFADTEANAVTARSHITNESAYLYNGSQAHATLEDASGNKGYLYLDAAGNLTLQSGGHSIRLTSNVTLNSTLVTNGGTYVESNAGAPGALVRPKGSLYMRTDGGVGTTMYVSQGGGTWNAVAGV